MKKILSFLLVFTLMFLSVCIFASCDTKDSVPTNSSSKKRIELTVENFKQYFTVEVDANVTEIENKGFHANGISVPSSYTGKADIDLKVFLNQPAATHQVSVTINVQSRRTGWEENTIKLNLDSGGRAEKQLTLSTLDGESSLFKGQYSDSGFSGYIVEVSGYIVLD